MSRFINVFNSSRREAAISRLSLAWGILLLGAVCASLAFSADAATINSISILVDDRPGGADIEKLLAMKPGDDFSLKKVNNSIKQIYKTGLFEEIRVVKAGEDRWDLTFILTSRPIAREIRFSGSGNISAGSLRARVYSLREDSPFSQEKLERAVAELQEILREEGEFDAVINTRTEKLPDSSDVNVFFDIESTISYVVQDIVFEGQSSLSRDRLLKAMRTHKGSKYIPSQLEQDIAKIRELFIAEDYQRAEIRVKDQEFDEDQKNVLLTLEVIPREKIVIEVVGADVPENLIKPIWEAQIFEEWGLDEGEAKIVAHLRRRGHVFATVSSRIVTEGNVIRVIHKVSPGKRYRITDTAFRGITHFTAEELKQELGLDEKVPFFGRTDGARLFEIPVEIEFLYKTQGYPDTRVNLNFIGEGPNKLRPRYDVEEGRQETIAGLSFSGAHLFGFDALSGVISCSEGGPFYQPTIQQDIEKLQNFYLDQGVRGTEIRALVESVDENAYAVNFQISEGLRVRVGEIVVTGNNVTRTSTILRELRIREGDFARHDAIRETKRRLENLGVFSEVRIDEIQISPDSMNLFVRVTEGERNYVSAGLGLETVGEPRSFQVWNSDVRVRGIAELIRGNIFGTAAQFSLVGQLSLREKRAVASWQQPYFFGLPVESFLNSWWEEEERTSFTYERQGISLSGVRAFGVNENWVFVTTLRYARTKLLTLEVAESEVDRQFFPYSTTSLSGSLIRDTRSDPFNPESGYFFSTALEWAYPLFNIESDFVKIFAKYQHFIPVWSDILFSFTARYGLGAGRMPIPERFFAGGSNSFRGTRYDDLGPKDPDSEKPVGGKALVLINFELSFPIFPQLKHLYVTVFYDKGNVFAQRRQITFEDMQDTVGLGLRYRTPMGPVRLELGWNPGAPEGQSKALIFITIGNIF